MCDNDEDNDNDDDDDDDDDDVRNDGIRIEELKATQSLASKDVPFPNIAAQVCRGSMSNIGEQSMLSNQSIDLGTIIKELS